MIRPIATVSAGTLASRLTGFVRDALIAALFGTGVVADAFLFAFQLVTVARRALSEGALNAVLVPAYLRIRNDTGADAAAAFAGRALGTIGVAVAGTALALGIIPWAVATLAPALASEPAFALTVTAFQLMLPYLALAGPVAVMAAVLNAHDRVVLTSLSPVLFNLVMILAVTALFVAGRSGTALSALLLAIAVGIAGGLQVFFLASAMRYARPTRVSLDHDMRATFCRALPGLIAQSGPQLLLLTGAIVASAMPGAVSWIYFASRLAELPLGLVSAATGAVLVPKLSSAGDEPNATSSAALQLAFGLALPASIGLALLAQPIVAVLLERGAFTENDSHATGLALLILATALPAQALTKPMAAIFFAREQMRQPLMATLAGLLVTLGAALWLYPDHVYAGVALAISLGSWLITLWLYIALIVRADLRIDAKTSRNLAFIGLAGAIMGAAIAAASLVIPVPDNDNVWARAVALGTLIALGMLVYASALRLFGVVNFRIIRSAFGKP
jgi:putative peptidoglycan lipid II flippase